MTAATAITIFHPPADSERFDAWMSDYLESARAADGFAGCRVSVRSDGRLDWGVQVSFRTAELLDEWLDSPGRKALLQRGEALGNWRRTADLVMTEHEAPPAGVAAFMHSVAPGKEADFVAAQVNLAA